jgi:tyrosyl-tRNA synthetase
LDSETFGQASSKPLAVYLGVDPTATSLHAGNLLAMLGLLHFHIRGHQAIALASPTLDRPPVNALTVALVGPLLQVGGATGTIGDPSGRSSERTFLDKAQLEANVAAITVQYERFLARGQAYADARLVGDAKVEAVGPVQTPKVVNNMEWFGQMSLLDFLRGTGKHARVQTMLNKDRCAALSSFALILEYGG